MAMGRWGSWTRSGVSIVALFAASAGSIPAFAQSSSSRQGAEAARTFAFNIPAKPLLAALADFTATTGIQVVRPSSEAVTGRSSAVVGNLSATEAFGRLLAGTGLTYGFTSAGTITIQRRTGESANFATPAGANVLDTIQVEAENQSPYGPGVGYIATQSTAGTKTNTPIIETPQSISVVTAAQIKDQKAQSIQEALSYTSGVAAQVVNSNPLTSDSVLLRGFDAVPESGNFYRDGMRYMTTIFGGKQEPYGLERLEVIKGASSVLYGTVAPGGLINAVSKRPTSTPLREVNLEYGNFDRKQLSADFGGPLDSKGEWLYRLTGLVRGSDTFVDYTRDDRIYIAPALTWIPSETTSLTIRANFQRMRTSSSGALPADGTLNPNPYGQLPRSRFLGEPSRNDFNNDTSSIGYLFDHAFSETLKLHHGFRYVHSDLFNQYDLGFEPPDHRTRNRLGWTFNDRATVLTTDTHLEYKLATGPVLHTMLAGIDYSRDTYKSDRRLDLLAPIDIFFPVYGKPPVAFIRNENPRRENERVGLYVQDQMKIADKLVVLLGGRQDWVQSQEKDLSQDPIGDDRKDRAFTGRAGVVYLADNGLAPYASFSQSFEPVSGTDREHNRFKPTTGEQYEVGIRYQPRAGGMLLSAAIFDLRRQNVTTPDPFDFSYSVQTGEVQSRGLELEAKANLTEDLNLIAAYSYTDARVTKSNTPAELGTRFRAPYHLFSIWADYKLGDWGLSGWQIGGGMRFSSDNPGNYNGGIGTPGFALFDLRLAYERGPMTYALNVKNLTDRKYISGECYFYGCRYGDPRTVIATASYRW